MTKAFLGFTCLIAALFPLGGYLASVVLYRNPLNGVLPAIFSPLFSLAMLYLPAAALAAWFFRSTQLAGRVPLQVPGSTLLLIGSILTAIDAVILLIRGGGVSASFDPRSLFIVIPARALLAVGAVQLLLSARPTNVALRTLDDRARDVDSPAPWTSAR